MRHPDDLPAIAAASPLAIGVITTPAPVAQRVADLLIEAGVRSMLNFAPRVLDVPGDVLLRYVDLSMELQVMSFYQARRLDDEAGRADAGHPLGGPHPRAATPDRAGSGDWRPAAPSGDSWRDHGPSGRRSAPIGRLRTGERVRTDREPPTPRHRGSDDVTDPSDQASTEAVAPCR